MCFAGGGRATGDTGETKVSEEDAQYAVSTVIGEERETKGVVAGWSAHDGEHHTGKGSAWDLRSAGENPPEGPGWPKREQLAQKRKPEICAKLHG